MARMLTRMLVLALSAGLLWVAAPNAAHALYSAQTTSRIVIGAASDWTAPSVALADPGSSVTGSVVLTAAASDAETGIQSVAIEYLAANGAWTPICGTTSAPYTCTWNTTAVADGTYELRARAEKLTKSGYGTYLLGLLDSKDVG